MSNYIFMNIDGAREILRNTVNGSLFEHCLGVEKTAFKLAGIYGADAEKAALAGLLHDYAKAVAEEKLYSIAAENSLADELSLQEPGLLHAPVGAWLLKHQLGLEDEEILEAVKFHTTGAAGMSLLAQIVYLADYIEPGRTHAGMEAVRKIAFFDLEKALLEAVNLTLKKVVDAGKILHPNSVSFRNSLIISFRRKSGDFKL